MRRQNTPTHKPCWTPFRPLDHQVDFEVEADVAQGLTDLWPHRKRRHELTVHHVDMDDSCSGALDEPHLLAQNAEIGSKN